MTTASRVSPAQRQDITGQYRIRVPVAPAVVFRTFVGVLQFGHSKPEGRFVVIGAHQPGLAELFCLKQGVFEEFLSTKFGKSTVPGLPFRVPIVAKDPDSKL